MGVIACDKPWCRCSRENGPSGTASTRDTSYNHITTPNRVGPRWSSHLSQQISMFSWIISLSGYRTKLRPSDFLGSIPTFQTLLSTIFGELFLVNLPIVFLVTPLAPPYCDLSASWQDIQWNCDRPAREPASGREEPWKNWSVCIVEPVIIGWSDNSRDNWITGKRSFKYSNGNFVVHYAPFSDRLK